MRIISGNFRGKKIIEPKDKQTRPLKDLTKESIFNIIIHSNKFQINIEDSNILDLFSGVGSFGIECLSRNAKYVTFVEKYNGVLNILKKNLLNLKKINNYEVVEKDVYNTNFFFEFEKTFDIIFLDPPYKDKDLTNILMNIYSSKCLDKNGVIIIHRHKNDQDTLTEKFKVIEQKIYGLSKIIFLSF
jgi:16S rRNA (guanine966-N2)-methyltransferase